jgi:hypothetical protein
LMIFYPNWSLQSYVDVSNRSSAHRTKKVCRMW